MEKVPVVTSQRKNTCFVDYLGHQLVFSGNFDSGNLANAEFRADTEVLRLFDAGSRDFYGSRQGQQAQHQDLVLLLCRRPARGYQHEAAGGQGQCAAVVRKDLLR